MKKHIIYIGLIYLVFILIAAVFVVSCKERKPPPPPEKQVYIYSLETPAGLSESSAKDLIINYLGEKEPKNIVQSQDNFVYYVSPNDLNTTFEQDLKTGNFTFSRNMNKYMGEYSPKLPAAGQAIEISASFLRKNQLYPKNEVELKLVHQGGLRAQSVVDGKKGGPIVDKLITLTYGRVLDSLPVIGAGSKIVVNIGDAGEIVGVVHRWREVKAGKPVLVKQEEMISQEEATELARKQIAAEYGEKTAYKINSVSKAYYDNNGNILQPVYSFETSININGGDKNVRPFNYLCVIPMLKNSPEPLQLLAIDPKAKEMIKSGRPGIKDSSNTNGKRTND